MSAHLRQSAPQENPARTIAFVGTGVGLVLILFLIAFALRPVPATPPTSYTTIVSPDKTFSVDEPVGWEDTSAGAEGSEYSGVLFRNPTRSVKIDITASEVGSIIADVSNAVNHPGSTDLNGNPIPVTPVVETEHADGESDGSDQFGDSYVEQPMQKINTGFGETCISEFTAGTGEKIHGYRVTEVNTSKEIVTFCSCHESDWPVMKPVFMHVIESIKPGPG
jgi:hypothetical protein